MVFRFLDRWQWVFLLLAAPFLLFPSPARSPILLVVPALWLIAWLARREAIPRTPLNVTLLLMFFMVMVSALVTFDVAFSLPKIAGMVLGIGVFYLFVREGQRIAGWWWCFLVYLTAGLGIAGLGLIGTKWSAKISFLAPITSRLSPRVTGLLGAEGGIHPNELAGALLWIIPLFVALSILVFLRIKDVRAAWGWGRAIVIALVLWGATLFVIGILVLTQSRGGYLGLTLAMIALLYIALPREWRWLWGGLIVLAFIVVVVISLYRGDVLLQMLAESGSALEPGAALNTWEGRMEVWSRGIYGIQDFPFTGMGMNTFRRVVHVLYPLFLAGPDVDIAHAHDEFLQAGLELGIPGLIAFIALYISAFWMLGEVWKNVQNSEANVYDTRTRRLVCALALGFGGGLFGHIVYGMTDAVALGSKPGVLFWMLLALIVGLFAQARSGQLARWKWSSD